MADYECIICAKPILRKGTGPKRYCSEVCALAGWNLARTRSPRCGHCGQVLPKKTPLSEALRIAAARFWGVATGGTP